MVLPRDDGYVHLGDYRPPAWRIDHAELEFELDFTRTTARARLHLVPDPGQAPAPLVLDGEDLELLAIALDGRELGAGEYVVTANGLQVPGARAACVLETTVALAPAANVRLEGLYRSGELLLTQCEAHVGGRRQRHGGLEHDGAAQADQRQRLVVESIVAGAERAPVERDRKQFERLAVEDQRLAGLRRIGRQVQARMHRAALEIEVELELDAIDAPGRRTVVGQMDEAVVAGLGHARQGLRGGLC